jgi:hypothetical protein
VAKVLASGLIKIIPAQEPTLNTQCHLNTQNFKMPDKVLYETTSSFKILHRKFGENADYFYPVGGGACFSEMPTRLLNVVTTCKTTKHDN